MSLVQLPDAQSRAGESVTQEMIDGLEAELEAEIGPLVGERTETFFLEGRLRHPTQIDGVYLSRRTSAITSANVDGTPLVAGTDYRFMGGYVIDLIDSAWWGDELSFVYTPSDEELVKEAVYDLLTYRSLPSNLQSVRIGQYSETYFPGGRGSDPVWSSQLSRILPAAGLGLTSPFRIATASADRTLIT